MTKYLDALQRARFQYDAAFHLLSVTYPMVKDPKLLIGILSNIQISMEAAMEAILVYERQLQLVPHYLDNFQSRFNTFRYKSVRRNKIDQQLVDTMETIQSLLDLHRQSQIEFRKDDRLIILDQDFHVQQLTLLNIREFLTHNQTFITIAEGIVNRKE